MATLQITKEMRARIARAFLDGRTDPQKALCCGEGAVARCADIVGPEFAESLSVYAYAELGCAAFDDPDYEQDVVERYTAKIADLTSLDTEEYS